MRVVFIGASEFGLECLQHIKTINKIDLVGVISNSKEFRISYSKHRVKNVLHVDYAKYCSSFSIPFYRMENDMKELELNEFLELVSPELIIVIGWYHLIPRVLLNKFTFIGIHASLLPNYSGGAPLVWAIINGERKTGVSLFYFDEGVDSGDIIAQQDILIDDEDTIKTLYEKVEVASKLMLSTNLPMLINGNASRTKQDENKRKIYPQRKPEDGLIDWTWDSTRIKNFIRAQTKPYPGAFTILENKKVIIWDADIIELEK